jgi:hypothetical protein
VGGVNAKRTFFDDILHYSFRIFIVFGAETENGLIPFGLLPLVLVNWSIMRPPVRLKPKGALANHAGTIIIGVIIAIIGTLASGVLRKWFGI